MKRMGGRLCDGFAYQWPLQPRLRLNLKVTHGLLYPAALSSEHSVCRIVFYHQVSPQTSGNVCSVYNWRSAYKRCKTITEADAVQLGAWWRNEHLMSRDCFDAKKQTLRAMNNAVHSMRQVSWRIKLCLIFITKYQCSDLLFHICF